MTSSSDVEMKVQPAEDTFGLCDTNARGCIYLACCCYAMRNENRKTDKLEAVLTEFVKEELFKRVEPDDNCIYVPLTRTLTTNEPASKRHR